MNTRSDLAVVPPGGELATLAERAERLRPHVERAQDAWDDRIAKKTRANYLRLFGNFTTWCAEQELPPLPAAEQTLRTYLAKKAADGCAAGTLRVILAAIVFHHVEHGLPSPVTPVVRGTLDGLRKQIGTRPKKKAAATTDLTRLMADTCDQTPAGLRDRALLLLLFAAARRRSEAVALDWAHLEWLDGEVRVLIERSKADQMGAGAVVRVALRAGSVYCPGAALRAWEAALRELHPKSDAIFVALSPNAWLERLNDASVAILVKQHAKAAGLDPKLFSGHSGRRGGITSLARAGRTLDQIKAISKHQSLSALNEYVEESKELDEGLL